MITNYEEYLSWDAQRLRHDGEGEKAVRIVSGVERNPVCTLNISRDDWDFNAMLMIYMPFALEIVRRIALDDIDSDDVIEIRERARLINDSIQQEHDKLNGQDPMDQIKTFKHNDQ